MVHEETSFRRSFTRWSFYSADSGYKGDVEEDECSSKKGLRFSRKGSLRKHQEERQSLDNTEGRSGSMVDKLRDTSIVLPDIVLSTSETECSSKKGLRFSRKGSLRKNEEEWQSLDSTEGRSGSLVDKLSDTSIVSPDIVLSISENAKELVYLINSSFNPDTELAAQSRVAGGTSQSNTATLHLLGAKALDLFLDLCTIPSAAQTAFLGELLGLDKASIDGFQSRIKEMNKRDDRCHILNGNGADKTLILKALEDLIESNESKVIGDHKKLRTLRDESEQGVEVVIVSQELAPVRLSGWQKKKSMIKNHFGGSNKSECAPCEESSIGTEEKEGIKECADESVLEYYSLEKEIALLVYEWMAYIAYEAIHYFNNMRLSTLQKSKGAQG